MDWESWLDRVERYLPQDLPRAVRRQCQPRFLATLYDKWEAELLMRSMPPLKTAEPPLAKPPPGEPSRIDWRYWLVRREVIVSEKERKKLRNNGIHTPVQLSTGFAFGPGLTRGANPGGRV